jgi:hypothetical protein
MVDEAIQMVDILYCMYMGNTQAHAFLKGEYNGSWKVSTKPHPNQALIYGQ